MSSPIMSSEEQPEEITRFVEDFANHPDKSRSTAERYRTSLRKWARRCEERDIPLLNADPDQIKSFVHQINSKHSPKTANNARAALAKFYEWMGEFEGKTPVDRADIGSWKADPEKENKRDVEFWLRPHEIEELVENVPAPKLRNRLLIRLLAQTGIRPGEVGTIRVGQDPDWQRNDLKDIDKIDRKIEVHDVKSSTNSSNEFRKVFYQPSLDELLRIWITTERNAIYGASESEYLFPTRQDVTMDNQAVNRVVRDAAENAGLQDVYMQTQDGRERHTITAHVLRHSFAMNALRGRGEESSGMDVRFIQKALGHDDIETTIDKYLHEDEEALREEWHRHGPSV